MNLRLCKIALTGASALFLALVVLNNLLDYGSNFAFVRHVLSMDTVFEGNRDSIRALTHPALHHAAYSLIILWEAIAMGLIAFGTAKLWQARAESAAVFQRAKDVASVGLCTALLLWYVAFIAIGGEWFLMWQSRIWNGQEAAGRMFLMMGLSLIFLQMRDDDGPVATPGPRAPSDQV